MFAKSLRAIALALGIGLIALPAAAAEGTMGSMKSMADCTPAAMHSAMMATSTKMSSMKSSGNMDKDYAAAMSMMAKSMRDMNAWEMKCGKDANAKKAATDSQKNFDALYHQFDNLVTTSS